MLIKRTTNLNRAHYFSTRNMMAKSCSLFWPAVWRNFWMSGRWLLVSSVWSLDREVEGGRKDDKTKQQ